MTRSCGSLSLTVRGSQAEYGWIQIWSQAPKPNGRNPAPVSRELGGEIITIGADGHAPDQIAWDFDKVPQLLKAAGFDYFTVFTKRKPEFLPV